MAKTVRVKVDGRGAPGRPVEKPGGTQDGWVSLRTRRRAKRMNSRLDWKLQKSETRS